MIETDATSIYRYYDRHDFLIYVGITGRGMGRNAQHNRRAEWWRFVVRQEVDHLPNREDALTLERTLIIKYRPPFNKQHNPDWRIMREAYYAWTQVELGREDPRELAESIGRTLPLVKLEQGPDHVSLRTEPEHYAISSVLRWVDGDRIHAAGKAARVRSIEMRGPFAVITVHGKTVTPVETAEARLRFLSQKPVQFGLRSIQFHPIGRRSI